MTTKTTATPAIQCEVAPAGDMVNGGLRLTFANGKTMAMQLRDLTAEIIEQATLHGLKQKLVDAAAMSRNPDTGRSATIDDKYTAVREVYDRLLSGAWNKPREGGSAGTLLLQALCRVYATKTREELATWLAGKDKDEQAALRKNPKIAKVIEEIRAENVDPDAVEAADAMLDELND